MRVSYLGPTGTYNEEALLESVAGREIERAPQATIVDAINAVEAGEVDRGLVPFENSIEGSVRSALDAIAFDTERVRIVGERDHPIRHSLIARTELRIEEIEVVLSHPQANAQCARFIRERLPGAEVRSSASTSDAVRQVSESNGRWAALGSGSAAAAFGCLVLMEGVEDSSDNVTRFVWLAAEGEVEPQDDWNGPWRTTLAFSELGDDHPGALVDALYEFSNRGINLTRIESRPLRSGLGRYLFFIDVDGDAGTGMTAEAVAALRGKAETVRVFGSYPLGGPPPIA